METTVQLSMLLFVSLRFTARTAAFLLAVCVLAPLATACAAPVAPVAPEVAQVMRPLEGEIELEGEINSIDVAKGTIEIMARGFATPTARRQLETPRAKIIAVNAQTRLLDANGKSIGSLSALRIGGAVRAVGRETPGQPFVARVLFWPGFLAEVAAETPAKTGAQSLEKPTVSAPATIAAWPGAAPQVAALLPPPQVAAGVSVRVLNAGFEVDEKRPIGASDNKPRFFFDIAVTAGAQLRFLGFVSPRFTSSDIVYSAIKGDHGALKWMSDTVDPRWPNLRAVVQVEAPGAPSGADGRFSQQYSVALPVPAPSAEPTPVVGHKWTTQKGTQIEIVSAGTLPVKSYERNRFKGAKDIYTVSIRWTPPPDAPDTRIGIDFNDWKFEGGTWPIKEVGGLDDYIRHIWTFQTASAPASIKAATARITVREFSPGWRQPQFFGIAEFDLPVAKIAQTRPLVVAPPVAPPLTVTDGNATAQLSAPRVINGWWTAALWTRLDVAGQDLASDNRFRPATRLIAREVIWTAPNGKTHRQTLDGNPGGDLFFDAEGKIIARGEAGHRLSFALPDGWDAATPLALEVRAQEQKIHSFTHDFRGLPIPPRGQNIELGDIFSDESATITRIGWTKWGTLNVVCDNTRIWQRTPDVGQSTLDIHTPIALDDAGHSVRYYETRQGDHLIPPRMASGGTRTIMLDPPTASAQTLDLAYGVTEVASGAERTFRFSDTRAAR